MFTAFPANHKRADGSPNPLCRDDPPAHHSRSACAMNKRTIDPSPAALAGESLTS
jgi:hypothetical protein